MPSYLNNYLNKQSGDGYYLTVISKDKKTVCRFTGFGNVQGPATLNGRPNRCWIWLGNAVIGDYDTKEEAAAALEKMFKAYKNREKAIEL